MNDPDAALPSQPTNVYILFEATTMSSDPLSCNYAGVHMLDDVPKYVVAGTSYRSQDGEFREFVYTWEAFSEEVSQIDLERAVLDRIESGELVLTTKVFTEEEDNSVVEFVESSRLNVKTFMLCWDRVRRITPNHANLAYQKIFAPRPDNIDQDYNESTVDQTDQSNHKHPVGHTIGQKIIPLSRADLCEVDDIRQPVWRECYIGRLAAGLTGEYFPKVSKWRFIYGASEELFDNQAMKNKYLEALTDNISTNIGGPTDRKPKPILYSDAAICIFMEHVGNTWRDLPDLIKSQSFDPEIFGANFPKYAHSVVSSLLVLNVKLGVVHGDLHTNNIMMDSDRKSSNTPVIIDFSRAVITDQATLEKDFTEEFIQSLHLSQYNQLYSLLAKFFGPMTTRFKDQLDTLRDDVPLLCKIISPIDVYILMSNVKVMLDVSRGDTKSHPIYDQRLDVSQGDTKSHPIIDQRLDVSRGDTQESSSNTVDDLLDTLIEASGKAVVENLLKYKDGGEIGWANESILRLISI